MSEANQSKGVAGEEHAHGEETIESISAAGPQSGRQLQIQIDDQDTPTIYSGTARVWGSAEEVNLDFLGPLRPTGQQNTARVKSLQRITMSPWAAKRLAIALAQAVERYERTYGSLELDERRRRRGTA